MKIAIIGDFRPENATHTATNDALGHSIRHLNTGAEVHWIPTDSLQDRLEEVTRGYQGFLIAPGSPYRAMTPVLDLIRYAREGGVPVFGTCGGFQHMVIEFARNVLGVTDAAHAEVDPYASHLVVAPLQCSLFGQKLEVLIIDENSRAFQLVRKPHLTASYYCNFGVNPVYQQAVHEAGLRIVGTDADGEVRIVELEDHPFFMGTLFVPQVTSREGAPHPLVTGFVRAALFGVLQP